MDDINAVKKELRNYNENVIGTGIKSDDTIVIYLKEEDKNFPKEYKNFKLVTKVTGIIKLQ